MLVVWQVVPQNLVINYTCSDRHNRGLNLVHY